MTETISDRADHLANMGTLSMPLSTAAFVYLASGKRCSLSLHNQNIGRIVI
jgi:hypothetical protein